MMAQEGSLWQYLSRYHRKRTSCVNASRCCNVCLSFTRSNEFYEEQNKLRRYFYVVDNRGQVFLEQTMHRNYATALRDTTFLNMLFTLLRPNQKTDIFPEKPYYFPCSKETNYVTLDDPTAAVVFARLYSDPQHTGKFRLQYGMSQKSQPFDPDSIFLSSTTGKFYHRILQHKYLCDINRYGLLHQDIVEVLSSNIAEFNGLYRFTWEGSVRNIKDILPP